MNHLSYGDNLAVLRDSIKDASVDLIYLDPPFNSNASQASLPASSGPRLEMFARGPRVGWTVWGNQADEYTPTWDTYANHSQSNVVPLLAGKLA